MTPEYIQQSLDRLEQLSGDDEAAHSFEDKLRNEFIEFVATGNERIAELAKLVLKTADIKFARWCA